jgi:hypothetical protein
MDGQVETLDRDPVGRFRSCASEHALLPAIGGLDAELSRRRRAGTLSPGAAIGHQDIKVSVFSVRVGRDHFAAGLRAQ